MRVRIVPIRHNGAPRPLTTLPLLLWSTSYNALRKMVRFTNFAELTWTETLHYYFVIFTAPFVLLWTILTVPFLSRFKTVRRVIWDRAFSYLILSLNGQQIQKFLGTDESVYRDWARRNGVEPIVDSVYIPHSQKTSPFVLDREEDSFQILWIGQKDAKKVVMYLHGGGFVSPIQVYSLMFWRYVQLEVAKGNEDASFSIAIPTYTLATQSPFPTQLRQACAALQYILNSGHVSPSNIIITGDSAGANLAYQLMQHIINPRISSIRPIIFPRFYSDSKSSSLDSALPKLAGVFFMSPWLDLRGTTRGYITNAASDIVSAEFYRSCGEVVLSGIDSNDTESQAWVLGELDLAGMEKYVENVLVFGGGKECLIDNILDFVEKLRGAYMGCSKGRVELMVKENGTHDDMFFDFWAGEKVHSRETAKVIEWVAERFRR